MVVIVFIHSIEKHLGRVIVKASNGGPDSIPAVSWELNRDEVRNCFIGQSYRVTIEVTDNPTNKGNHNN